MNLKTNLKDQPTEYLEWLHKHIVEELNSRTQDVPEARKLPEYWTVEEYARIHRVSERTVRRWIRAGGVVRSVKVGGRRLLQAYDEEEPLPLNQLNN